RIATQLTITRSAVCSRIWIWATIGMPNRWKNVMAGSTPDSLTIRTIGFSDWQRGIAPLWRMVGSCGLIQPTTNCHGQMQDVGTEYFHCSLLFLIAAERGGRSIGWTSVYNISDEAVRVRGIYVLPEFRSQGVGRAIVGYAMDLWPASWKRCFMYAW